jgi:hydroxymethylpyrimidine pyrophosphatase-like HAD family hydrolase
MKIDLIALDLDDTLLNSSLNISEGNRRAIIAAENAGIEIVLATGRNYAGVRKYIPLLDLGRKGNYLVCSNGAEILEAATGSVIERLMLSSEFCREASEFIDSEGWKNLLQQSQRLGSHGRKNHRPALIHGRPQRLALQKRPDQVRRARRAGNHSRIV